MSHLPAPFMRPPPENWEPKIGEWVQLLFRDKVHRVIVTAILDKGGYVVSGDSLLLPVVCTRDLLRPLDEAG